MFERKKYKTFAKKMLEKRWLVPVLVTLVIFIVNELFALPTMLELFKTSEFQTIINGDFNDLEELSNLFTQASAQTSGGFILTLVQSLVEYILTFAALSLYLKITRSPEKVQFKSFFEGFNYWWKAVLAFLWETLWTFLWMLVFFIPGIIKSFAYSQMPFILNEFENVSVTKSMRISMEITKGHKWDIFVMYLSFIGWDILCALTLGIGNLWLTPYKQVTYMNAFHAMLKEAIDSGRIKPEDLQ